MKWLFPFLAVCLAVVLCGSTLNAQQRMVCENGVCRIVQTSAPQGTCACGLACPCADQAQRFVSLPGADMATFATAATGSCASGNCASGSCGSASASSGGRQRIFGRILGRIFRRR